jgi:hypothetical protein
LGEIRFDKRSSEKVHIFGKDYECTRPTVYQQLEYESKLSKLKDLELVEHVFSYLEQLGIPRISSKELEMGQVLELVSYLSKSDKKK